MQLFDWRHELAKIGGLSKKPKRDKYNSYTITEFSEASCRNSIGQLLVVAYQLIKRKDYLAGKRQLYHCRRFEIFGGVNLKNYTEKKIISSLPDCHNRQIRLDYISQISHDAIFEKLEKSGLVGKVRKY